jgi:L-ascorbate metabolism protein UlaG (beta-lactamase superfamily)
MRQRYPTFGYRVAVVVLIAGVVACRSPSPTTNAADRFDLAAGTVELAADEVAIEYIGHAAFRVHSPDGTRIIIDPFASRVWLGYDFPDSLQADAVLITHPHYDHDAGARLGRPFPWGPDVTVYSDPGSHMIGDVAVQGVRGKHADPYGMEFGQINTLWVLEVADIRIAHLGDNGPLTESNMAALGRVDVLMMPIDGDYHILAAEEIEANLAGLEPQVLIPMHYRLPDLETDPESPSDLGPIDPWLEGRTNVERLSGHVGVLSREALPSKAILVFAHSPEVKQP